MSTAILIAATASLLIGTGEFLAGRVLRDQRSETVTATFFAVGFVLTVVVAPLLGGEWVSRDMVVGAFSGVFNGVALVMLYRAYARVSVGVAAPIAATIFAMLPVVFGVVARDGSLNGGIVAGILLGLAGVTLSAFDPAPTSELRSGVALAAAAGLIYGVALILLGEISEDSGAWSLLPQRAVAFAVAVTVAARSGPTVFPRSGNRVGPAFVGLFGSLGAIAFLLAAQRGEIGPVSVAGSQFAAVADALAWLIDRDRLRWWRTLGLCCAAAAVTFMALSG